VTVNEGDYLLAIDGVAVTTEVNPYKFLENTAGRVVVLRVNDRPDLEGAREERVRPIARETNLRYLDWVQERRRIVDETGSCSSTSIPRPARTRWSWMSATTAAVSYRIG